MLRARGVGGRIGERPRDLDDTMPSRTAVGCRCWSRVEVGRTQDGARGRPREHKFDAGSDATGRTASRREITEVAEEFVEITESTEITEITEITEEFVEITEKLQC